MQRRYPLPACSVTCVFRSFLSLLPCPGASVSRPHPHRTAPAPSPVVREHPRHDARVVHDPGIASACKIRCRPSAGCASRIPRKPSGCRRDAASWQRMGKKRSIALRRCENERMLMRRRECTVMGHSTPSPFRSPSKRSVRWFFSEVRYIFFHL